MKTSPKGPWTQRVAVVLFTALTGILVFWLLGFVVEDIEQLKGPQQSEVERRALDPALVTQEQAADKQTALIQVKINDLKARQQLLRDSTTSSQQTMNQLLEMQKLSIQNQVKPTAAEQEVLAESVSLFIANQTRYQQLNEEIAKHSEEQRNLSDSKRGIESRLGVQREKAVNEFERLNRRHRLRVAALQLLFLIPVLLVVVYLVLKWRATMYAPLLYVIGIATLAKVIGVVHENFPSRYFKYVLLVAALAVVIRVLVHLIRATKSPKLASLLKQYREAYERFLCPICEYPIRRGPMKYSFWDRRSIRDLRAPGPPSEVSEEPYSCPSCGSALFERCTNCQTVRHTLLLFCDRCGNEKELGQAMST